MLTLCQGKVVTTSSNFGGKSFKSSVPSMNGMTCDGVRGVDQAMAALKHYQNKNFPGLSCLTDNVSS